MGLHAIRFLLSAILIFSLPAVAAVPIDTSRLRHASFAKIDYDVVYVRCPRGREVTVYYGDKPQVLLNWNGVNDVWIDGTNNIHHQPGCDLVLHHSDPNFGNGLAVGDPKREEVLVDCDEAQTLNPVCSVVDPNVSFDGKRVIFSKFTDTRKVITSYNANTGGGSLGHAAARTMMKLFPERDANGAFATQYFLPVYPYAAPALIFEYNLETRKETRVSPGEKLFGGRANPGKPLDWNINVPVFDTGPMYLPDGRIGFTSNRNSGFLRFELFTMDADGSNLELIGHRAMASQLHPAILQDGRIMYSSTDVMLQKVANNQVSLFAVNPDGSFPFILAGKQDATKFTYHFATQLSDGDIVSAIYYNRNNTGMGSLLRFPVDPPGPDFTHLVGTELNNRPYDPTKWVSGGMVLPFARKGQYILTEDASADDHQVRPYTAASDFWIHPVGQTLVTMTGKYSHPSGGPDNGLLVTYTIGGSSMEPSPVFSTTLAATMEMIGKDGGIWLLPLERNSQRTVGHIANDAQLVVDFPQYHEIMPRAVVPYGRIHGIVGPARKAQTPNSGTRDPRLPAGKPYGLSGAATLFDRETRSLNGTPWNMVDGGGTLSGRTYSNLATNGADLAIFANSEVYGIRVTMPVPQIPTDYSGGHERWAGIQDHHLRILGEFPVRKPSGTPLDGQGNPDTSFIVRLPAHTPFLFQTLDKRGMALDIETTSRALAPGEQQFCGGCHVHTRTSLDPFTSVAKLDTSAPFGDFTGDSAPLLSGFDAAGLPTATKAKAIYPNLPGVASRHSFAVDWDNGISAVIQNRCASCHGAGMPAEKLTGLRLDGTAITYELLLKNKYTREDRTVVDANTLPGDGLTNLDQPGTDRITPHFSCCTPSRWLSLNSARSSMLVWALYGERLDGRDPLTGLPPVGSGVLVDDLKREHPEIWPKVSEHAAYVVTMPEEEKRLIARWLDLGAPKLNIHNDTMRPVVTVTPQSAGDSVSTLLIGLWDDSALDFSRFKVTFDGADITPKVTGSPDVVSVTLPVAINSSNARQHHFTVEIWDKPDRTWSLVSPSSKVANQSRQAYNGSALLRLANTSENHAPSAASAKISTTVNTVSVATIPVVVDADIGDSHMFEIVSEPAHGTAGVVNNRLVYLPTADFAGVDQFMFKATDLAGMQVVGRADISVAGSLRLTPPPVPPTSTAVPPPAPPASAAVPPAASQSGSGAPTAPDSGFATSTPPANGAEADTSRGGTSYWALGIFLVAVVRKRRDSRCS